MSSSLISNTSRRHSPRAKDPKTNATRRLGVPEAPEAVKFGAPIYFTVVEGTSRAQHKGHAPLVRGKPKTTTILGQAPSSRDNARVADGHCAPLTAPLCWIFCKHISVFDCLTDITVETHTVNVFSPSKQVARSRTVMIENLLQSSRKMCYGVIFKGELNVNWSSHPFYNPF